MDDTSYEGTLKLFRIRPDVFDYWTMEIKKCVGQELARAGIYPPDRYIRKTWNGQGIWNPIPHIIPWGNFGLLERFIVAAAICWLPHELYLEAYVLFPKEFAAPVSEDHPLG